MKKRQNKHYILFRLEEDIYGAEINDVREIILLQEPTKVPNNPDFIEGVIDYRGSVAPLLDMKKRFRVGKSPYTEEARLIVSDVNEGYVSFLVDEIVGINRLDPTKIDQVPKMTKIGKEYLTGVIRDGDQLIILVNMSKILTVEEKEIIENLKKKTKKK
ncbi:MAG TPA: chemotaxis protein CheW [Bacillota bacterium]|nr:chemotaxis protein CheW [Bacillota bacterium]